MAPGRRADIVGLAIVGAAAAVLLAYLFAGGAIVGVDSIVQFYLMYDLVGAAIQRGDLPGWNPHLFSGSPLAADPQSGWFYLPVMAPFALFALPAAAAVLTGSHLLLAGGGTFALARAIGIGPLGASAAALAYLGNGWYTQRAGCCPVDTAVASWLPWPLLGLQMAVAATSWRGRLLGWLIAGVAVSQILSVWLGQGAYYAVLAAGWFGLYRTVLAPAVPNRGISGRLADAVVHGGAVALIGLGLAAGGLLPRLDYVGRSTLADGYPVRGDGWRWHQAVDNLLGLSTYAAGNITVGLALAGAIVLGRRALAPCWTVLAAAAVLFSLDRETPVHSVLYALLPRFEDVQSQIPARIMFVAYLAVALLAGALIGDIASWRATVISRWGAACACVALASYAVWVGNQERLIEARSLAPLAGVALLALAVAAMPRPAWRRIAPAVPVLAIVAIVVDVGLLGYACNERRLEAGTIARVDLSTYFDPSPAARFLVDAAAAGPFRFVGVDPSGGVDGRGGMILYGRDFADPFVGELVVNNRAAVLGLQDAQGINNPAQLKRYTEFIEALNGQPQDYHNATLLSWDAVASPLLGLLNVRYAVVPNPGGDAPPDLRRLIARLPTVFQDDNVRILELPDALPRAWIVHEARHVVDGEALSLLVSGTVDPRRVALLEERPPPLDRPRPGVPEAVTVTVYEPDRVVLSASSSGAGLLLLSEVYAPGWTAYVDGERTDVLVADHALRAVSIPAGESVIELRYSPRSAVVGGIITGATGAVLALIAVYAAWRTTGKHWTPSRWAGSRRAPMRRR